MAGSLTGLELTGPARLTDHQASDILESRLEQRLVLQCWRQLGSRSPWEVGLCWTLKGQYLAEASVSHLLVLSLEEETQAFGEEGTECLGS